MYIEKHSIHEGIDNLSESLESSYEKTDTIAAIYSSERPQAAEKSFLFGLMQKDGECLIAASTVTGINEEVEIMPGVFTNVIQSECAPENLPTVDYAVREHGGGSLIVAVTNIPAQIIRGIMPEAKTVTKTVARYAKCRGPRLNPWDCAAAALVGKKEN